MRLCDDTVTIFNARADPETGGHVWTGTVIAGVSWYATDAATVDAGRGGLVAAGRIIVRIPADANAGGKAWADPMTYASAAGWAGLWTLRTGDVLIKGAVPLTRTRTVNGEARTEALQWTPAELRKSYADYMTILAVTDNRRAPKAPHWRITGE